MSKSTDKKRKLTPQQERFCLEYIIDLNATASAKRAGYSEKTAEQLGYQLLQIPSVIDRVAELKATQAKRLEINADFVLKELLEIARSDIGKVFDEKGALLPVNSIPKSTRKAISSVEVCTEWETVDGEKKPAGTTTKFKFWKKEKALELLGKHLKLWTDKVEVSGNLTLEQLVLGSMDKDEDGSV